ncbi:BRICHOS domain-containing protein 5 isoform X1 [Dunckerocampus dactyliophorus]|uniref:BRICHOS domain-containing protein 5 isoform X1 n=1 Tax=Dunckerocampus dactyliophorus TaxID=161453 RepID=UPI00240656D6|nr:BRICHOS domain-containing protein 5 isoform X1 [Dunckerocampus dactyliophorus]
MEHRMVKCWNLPEGTLEGGCCLNGVLSASVPKKVICVSLSASLLLVLLALGLTGHLGLPKLHSRSSQAVRIIAPDPTGALLLNQSAVVDQQNGLVTFSVTSGMNLTSTVLFDIKHGVICYQPVHQESCFLRTMETSDYENVHALLQASVHKSHFQLSVNETRRRTEFFGVLAATQTDLSNLEEPLQVLCRDRPIHWTKRADGPGKQRLVYFCIDICFPNNICMSMCFYYLPD